ncbi:RICIN domain-containing protein [Kitasatospora sp. NPDC001539]|uniref:RICIN domain-containing protein n=1 Tax=Kitasatospora sp. NPDC001539 TaxID=3154384 RepID=UPI00332035EA
MTRTPTRTATATALVLVAALAAPAAAAASAPPRRARCLGVGDTRHDADPLRVRPCLGTAGQRFTLDGGRVKVTDTVGTAREMCLDVDYTGENGDDVRIWSCERSRAGRANQTWLLREGSFVLQRTVGTADEMCVDVGPARDDGDAVFLATCGPADPDQAFVLDDGAIEVRDTL